MPPVSREGRKVFIPGVRKVSWDTGEMCEFASAMVSALQCLGDPIPYEYVMGASGAAFRFTLNPGEWDFGNYSIRNIAPDPFEPVRRALDAVGYGGTLSEKTDRESDTARVMESIDRGVPVLAFGVVGPSDCVIITGYDEGGDVLMGWSTYQDIPQDHNFPHDVTGYFRKPGWHEALGGYLLIGSKMPPRPKRAIYLEALRWAVYLICMPEMGKKRTGLEGLKTWAKEMVQEQYFPAEDKDLLGWRYVSVTINITMLRDHYRAEPFLRQAAVEIPDFAPELLQAADCYTEGKRIGAEMDQLINDNFSEQAMQAVGDPQIRKAFAERILEVRQVEEQALGYLEELLKRCR